MQFYPNIQCNGCSSFCNNIISLMCCLLKVEEKFNAGAGISWKRAMDEVRTDRLIAKHSRDTLRVIIRNWPDSGKYKDNQEPVASLEYLVCIHDQRLPEMYCGREAQDVNIRANIFHGLNFSDDLS